MHAGIGLMYVEGEVRGGCITGRTVLVVETSREIDPTSPNYSFVEIDGITKLARAEWEKRFGPADLVRLERQQDRLLDSVGCRHAEPRLG